MKGKSIVLIGMMGAGKSSIGRWLHRETGLALLDTDEIASANSGISIAEIFEKHGEQKFRDLESNALAGIPSADPIIVVTGGGIVLREENIALLKKLGAIVWLDAEDDVLFERASRRGNRPLLQTGSPREAFAKLLEARKPLYAKIAEIRIDTTGLRHEEVARATLNRLEELSRR